MLTQIKSNVGLREEGQTRVPGEKPLVAEYTTNRQTHPTYGAGAYFRFVNGRCHLKRSMPFFSSELHLVGLRTQKVAVTGSCVSLVI